MVRIALTAGLFYFMYLATTQAVASWYFRYNPLPEGAQKAIEWDPRNPDYYRALGSYYEQSVLDWDIQKAVRFYEKAVELSPNQARLWADLGGAYAASGRPEEAQRAFERARELFPNSPRINWRLANFYIRQNRPEKALPALRKTLLGDPTIRVSVFDLAWRAGIDPDLILTRMLPSHVGIQFQYLHYLVRSERLDAAAEVWQKVLELASTFEPRLAFPYLDALIRDQRVSALQSAWEKIGQRNPTLFHRSPWENNLIHNGGFESQILNGGLGWRIRPVSGVVVSVDTTTFFDGTRSLRIGFNGEKNISYRHIEQYVPVEPNRRYRFVGYIRGEALTTDSGPRFRLQDAYDRKVLELVSEPMLGTASWRRYELDFVTSPETKLLLISVIRTPSRKFDNMIDGTAWIDRINLEPVD